MADREVPFAVVMGRGQATIAGPAAVVFAELLRSQVRGYLERTQPPPSVRDEIVCGLAAVERAAADCRRRNPGVPVRTSGGPMVDSPPSPAASSVLEMDANGMSTRAAAALLGIGERQVRRLVRPGRLAGVYIGGVLVLDPGSVSAEADRRNRP